LELRGTLRRNLVVSTLRTGTGVQCGSRWGAGWSMFRVEPGIRTKRNTREGGWVLFNPPLEALQQYYTTVLSEKECGRRDGQRE